MNINDIVSKLWNLCHVLRDDGITYQEYVNELSFLLFLKMMKETNQEGDLPEGYRSKGARTPLGVGQVTRADLARLAADKAMLDELRKVNEAISSIVGALEVVSDEAHRARIIDRYRSLLSASAMRQQELLKAVGLVAPAAL